MKLMNLSGRTAGFRSFFHKNSFLVRVLLYYIVIGAILVSVLSFILYDRFSRSSFREINSISDKMLEQAYRFTEGSWYSTYNNMLDVINRDIIVGSALYDESFDGEGFYDLTRHITRLASSNPLVYSVNVYNAPAGYVFSSQSSAMPIAEFYDRELVQYLKTNILPHSPVFLPRSLNFKIGTKQVSRNVITVILSEYVSRKPPESALVINLDQQELQKTAAIEKNGGAYQVFIVNNRDGMIISHPDLNMIHKVVREEPYIDRILSGSEKKGHFTEHVQGKKHLISYIKSDNLGWTFINMGDYEKLSGNVTEVGRAVLLFAGLFILLSILIAVFFTSRVYKPVYQLLKKIREGNKGSDEQKLLNELDYISSSYDNLVSYTQKLQSSVRSGMPVVKRNFLTQLLSGEFKGSSEEFRKHAEEIEVRLDASHYLVLLCKIDGFEQMELKYSRNDIGLFRFAVGNIAEEIFGECFSRVEAVEYGEDGIAVILGAGEPEEEIEGKVREAAARMQEAVARYLEFTVTAGVGCLVQDPGELHESFRRAQDAVRYRITHGCNTVIRYSNVEFGRSTYEYPFEKERQFIEALKLGDRARTTAVMDQLFAEIGHYSYDEILLSLTQMVLSFVRVAKELAEGENDAVLLDYKSVYKKLTTLDELGQIKEWMLNMCLQVIEQAKDKRDNKSRDIVEGILEYIHANFREPAISVESVADLVKLSPNYVRTLFKNHTGQSLSTYINDLRFEEFKRLLLATDTPAKKIAENVGFTSITYFFTLFKKVTGKSPDDFRKENCLKSINQAGNISDKG